MCWAMGVVCQTKVDGVWMVEGGMEETRRVELHCSVAD